MAEASAKSPAGPAHSNNIDEQRLDEQRLIKQFNAGDEEQLQLCKGPRICRL